MSSRRDFFKKSALVAGAAALPPSITAKAMRDEQPVSSATTTGDLPYKDTYIKNIFVTENEFRNADPAIIPAPDFKTAKTILPSPFWKGNDAAIEMYWKAWELGFSHIKDPAEGSGFISSYIDTAYNGNIFMWDSNFITLFARYGTRAFPFQKTLDNFYAKQHIDGFICREIWGDSGKDCFSRFDPTSTGPNIIPWSEMEYFRHFGEWDRVHKIFPVLSAYYQWLREYRTWKDGSYWSSGWGTGMDNMPRLQRQYNPIFSNGHMTWIDTCLQQLFIGKILVDFGFFIERWQEIEDIEDEVKNLKDYVKNNLWDPETAFFYDKYADGTLGTVKGIGAYWALWADVLDKDQMDAFVKHLSDPETFNRTHPVPSIPANHEKYRPDGRYWQGGVWAPTNYMIIKGLMQNNYHKLAFDLAMRHHQQVKEVFNNTGTLWEYYAPEATEPGFLARPDFVGWTGLVPVAVLYEAIFGLTPNYLKSTLKWNVNLTDEHGVERYPYGPEGSVNLKCAARGSARQKPELEISTNVAFKLELSWESGKKTIDIQPGTHKV
jgi:hypothetical protein